MKRNILLITVIILGLFAIGCSDTVEKGLLQGKVLISPTSPMEQPGQESTLRCEFYDARKIMIYDQGGTNLIQQVDIDCNADEQTARYRVELKTGIYTIDINHIGIDYSDDIPEQVEIKSGITFRLDIDIDTGIR